MKREGEIADDLNFLFQGVNATVVDLMAEELQ